MYNDVVAISTPLGNNIGGVCSFKFVLKEWLADEIFYNQQAGAVITAPNLLAGHTWLGAFCLFKSMEYAEKDKSDKGGNYVEASLSGVVLRDDIAAHTNIDTLRYHELVVIYTDRNGLSRIIGGKAKGMTFAADYTTGKKPEDPSQYLLSLVHQMAESAPRYIVAGSGGSSVPVGPGI